MFDLSMVELGVIALVALLVLGPERLPKAARTLGFYVRKARQSWYSVRAEFERELAAEELKRSLKLDEVHATLDDTARTARDGLQLSAEAKGAANGTPPPHPQSAPFVGHDPSVGDDELTPEERARQSEPMALEPEADCLGANEAAEAAAVAASSEGSQHEPAPSRASDAGDDAADKARSSAASQAEPKP